MTSLQAARHICRQYGVRGVLASHWTDLLDRPGPWPLGWWWGFVDIVGCWSVPVLVEKGVWKMPMIITPCTWYLGSQWYSPCFVTMTACQNLVLGSCVLLVFKPISNLFWPVEVCQVHLERMLDPIEPIYLYTCFIDINILYPIATLKGMQSVRSVHPK